MQSPFLGELLGTLVLILLGDGVVAGVVLERSKSQNGGWIVITTGWAFAVIFGVLVAKAFGSADAHLNPAVTVGFAILNNDFSKLYYILAQFLGAFLGAVLVYLHFLPHWKEANSSEAILAVFSTEPAIHHPLSNFLSEALGTFVLILGIWSIFHPSLTGLTTHLGTFFVGLLVWSIGLSRDNGLCNQSCKRPSSPSSSFFTTYSKQRELKLEIRMDSCCGSLSRSILSFCCIKKFLNIS